MTQQDILRLSVIEQLHPQRIGYSPKMLGLVACIVQQPWCTPLMERVLFTSDHHMLGVVNGMANIFLGGTERELSANWKRLLDYAKLTPAEKRVAYAMYRRAVGRPVEKGRVPKAAYPKDEVRP